MVNVPKFQPPHITSSSLLQEQAHFLELAPTCTRIVKQIAELAGIWLDFLDVLLKSWIAFEYQYLVLGPAFLAYSVHLDL